MKENNISRIRIELDCGNCPLQKDEEIEIKNKLYELFFNCRGIEIKSFVIYD